MESPKLHKVQVGCSVWADGVSTVSLVGTPRTIDGSPMVQLAHGPIMPADGWHATEAEAKAAAANEIEKLGRGLLDQAKRFRDIVEATRQEVSL